MMRFGGWVVLGLVAVGCGGQGGEDEQLGDDTLAVTRKQGQKLQGQKLQGTALDGVDIRYFDLANVRLSETATTTLPKVRVEKGRLTYDRSGVRTPLPVGATVRGIPTTAGFVTFRIGGIQLPDADTHVYQLQHRTSSGSWVASCPNPPAGESYSGAVPLGGYWDSTGAWVASTRWFSMGCTSAVLGKCYRWGYRPWDGASRRDLHQACTRMARADYCGDGRSYTVDGTTINVWDYVPIQRYETATGMKFEAGWTPAGATCLSKLRWEGLPVGTPPCGGRLVTPGQQKKVCNTQQEARTWGALTFNESFQADWDPIP